ncbi:MAG TPA: hypothetical protein VN715_15420 [Roseiarcus sp.]|nr:hypothetical protein [Roseiarcus sp.]
MNFLIRHKDFVHDEAGIGLSKVCWPMVQLVVQHARQPLDFLGGDLWGARRDLTL